MTDRLQLAVLGGGKMGEAFIAGLLSAAGADTPGAPGADTPGADTADTAGAGPATAIGTLEICVAEVDPARRDYLEEHLGVATTGELAEAVRGASAILIAVKPGDVPKCLQTCREAVDPAALVISIAAGVTLHSLEACLPGKQKVVRAMPNLGATVRAGVSAFVASASAGPHDVELAEAILGAVGPVVRLEDENLLDLVTAVSGSGPAYVFALAEAMQAAAVRGGLSGETAYLLVSQTILGAAHLLTEAGPNSPEGLTATEWREAVTSKGGTTAAALAVFNESGFSEVVERAIEAARTRSEELGS